MLQNFASARHDWKQGQRENTGATPRGARSLASALLVVSLLSTGLSAVLFSAPAHCAPPEPLRYTLDNGLKVILAPRQKDLDAYVAVKYNSGQTAAPMGYRGLPHLAEHLSYHGSKHIKPLDYFKYLGQVGAGANGVTHAESTVYYLTAPPSALALALWLESDRMGFSLDGVTEEALATEKRVVQNELKEKEGFFRMLSRHKDASLYGAESPGVSDPDEVQNVGAATLSGVRWFIQSTHRPDNATLAVGGNIEPEQAKQLVKKYFGPLKNPSVKKLKPLFAAPRLCGAHKLRLGHSFLGGSSVVVSWPLPAASTEQKRQTHWALARLLQELLEESLQVERSVASDINVSLRSYESHNLLEAWVDVHPKRPLDSTEKVILGSLQALADNDLGDALEPYKKTWQLRRDIAAEDGQSRILSILHGEDPDHASQVMGDLSSKDIQQLAQQAIGNQLTTLCESKGPSRATVRVLGSDNPCE